MSERVIRISSVEDATIFANASEKCDDDVELSQDDVTIDAKSLVGIFRLDLSRPLTAHYKAGENAAFEKLLEKFAEKNL